MAIRKPLLEEPPDNRPRCGRCHYFDRAADGGDDGGGYCRRYPTTAGDWSIVLVDDWCGEYLTASLPAETSDGQTMSIAEAGKRYFGLSVNASYLAARRGDLPWVRIGKQMRVPVSAMRHLQPREE